MFFLTKGLHAVVIVVGEQEIPDLLPLNFGSHATCPFSAEEFRHRGAINTRLWVVVSDVAHLFFRQTLVVSEILFAWKVAVATITHEGRRIIALVLLHNMLPDDGQVRVQRGTRG